MATTAKEIRALPVTIRAAGEGEQRTIGGAILYGKETALMRDYWGDAWCEELAAGCFDDSLQARDVVALWSHDTAAVLGNTRNRTLRLESGETRLDFDLDLPDTTAGRDAFESVKRGDVSGVSFGMVVTKDKWTTEKRDDETVYKRTILAAELWEVSPCTFPAYPANEVTCRSLEKFKGEIRMSEQTKNTEPKATLEDKIKEIEEELKELRTNKGTETRTVPAVAIPATPVDKAKEQRAAFNHYLRTGEIRDNDSALTVGGGGAALAPDDFAKEIIDGLNDEVVLRGLARILPPISGKSAVYPRRTGGGGAAMVAEGAAITPQDLEFDQIKLVPQKAAALVEVSNELLQDSGVDLAGYLSQHFVDEIGELLESEYWSGVGVAPNLQGILTAEDGDGLRLVDRVQTAGTTVDVDDVLDLWAALPAKYRKNATFVCNSAMEAQLRKLKDENGQYLMVHNLTEGLGSTLLGRPLKIAEAFPGDLESGDDALMVGDFGRAVFIADKAGIDIQRNDAIGFNKDTTAFRAILRTDVALALPEAVKVLAIKE